MTYPTNEDRANWADESIQLFARNTGLDDSGDDDETAFKDLLADMRHWCAQRGIDFDDLAEGSREVYGEEVAEEEGE
jgi:hypothetical protein